MSSGKMEIKGFKKTDVYFINAILLTLITKVFKTFVILGKSLINESCFSCALNYRGFI
ncbi:hypothetical protein BCF58_1691 [Chryseobacterium defluvii]|uniref:Uncharacterized protein n=1 Tax=Chryseobacterium defluvii TaxID=160396 RepID=A0A495SBF7_9FLAO|nr:hypothetical protein BCF58_1691 [Chryseobacterium defluvii]